MIIIDKKLTDLIPYENNPRKNDSAVSAVAASINQFGFKVPIVIDENDVIICGHTRYKAAELLKLETVPCILADDLTPEQIKAFRLADNKTSELSGWDVDLLIEELKDITDIDMTDFAFDVNVFLKADEPKEQKLDNGEELDIDDYNDDEFKCKCPKCGFKFNPKE